MFFDLGFNKGLSMQIAFSQAHFLVWQIATGRKQLPPDLQEETNNAFLECFERQDLDIRKCVYYKNQETKK